MWNTIVLLDDKPLLMITHNILFQSTVQFKQNLKFPLRFHRGCLSSTWLILKNIHHSLPDFSPRTELFLTISNISHKKENYPFTAHPKFTFWDNGMIVVQKRFSINFITIVGHRWPLSPPPIHDPLFMTPTAPWKHSVPVQNWFYKGQNDPRYWTRRLQQHVFCQVVKLLSVQCKIVFSSSFESKGETTMLGPIHWFLQENRKYHFLPLYSAFLCRIELLANLPFPKVNIPPPNHWWGQTTPFQPFTARILYM